MRRQSEVDFEIVSVEHVPRREPRREFDRIDERRIGESRDVAQRLLEAKQNARVWKTRVNRRNRFHRQWETKLKRRERRARLNVCRDNPPIYVIADRVERAVQILLILDSERLRRDRRTLESRR